MPLTIAKQRAKPKKIIGIAAGKGGVGKSTLTVNLARALSVNHKVGILDADVYGPSIQKLIPEEILPKQVEDIIIPGQGEGIKLMSIAHYRKVNEALVVRAPIACKIVSEFLELVDWGDLDYLLIDFPPGTGDIQLTLSQKSQMAGVIMITTPQEVATLDVQKAIHMFNVVNVPILGIVENMSYYHNGSENVYIFGKGGGERLAKENALQFLGQIPIDPTLSKNADLGLAPQTLEPFHEIARKFQLNY